MSKPEKITRGKVDYYIYEDKVVVRLGSQYVSYNQYDNWNRQGITKFIKAIEQSKPDEYGTAADQMSLAMQCGIKGSSAHKPKELR